MSFTEGGALEAKTSQAWFGGSFDPVHIGHLIAAQELLYQLHLDRINLTPCYLSPHKQQSACSPADRLGMLELACDGCDYLRVDKRELDRGGQSKTIDTLREIRAELGEQTSLIWVVGWDAFQGLHTWYESQKLLDLCNIVVVSRPGYSQSQNLTPEMDSFCHGREVPAEELQNFNFGKVLILDTPLVDISSSAIRHKVSRGVSIRYFVPDKVAEYINEQGLYK